MAQFTAKWAQMKSNSQTLASVGNRLMYCNLILSLSAFNIPFSSEISYQIRRVLQSEQKKFFNYSKKLGKFKSTLNSSADLYKKTEENLLGDVAVTTGTIDIITPSKINDLALDSISEFGMIGSIFSAYGMLLTGGNPAEKFIKMGNYSTKAIENISGAFDDMAKSNASFDWKTLFGVQKAEAKSFLNYADDFVDDFNFGKSAVGNVKATAKWGGVALTGLLNLYDNIQEGNSVGRTISETALETGIDVGLGAIIGVAASTIAGTVGAPVVLAGAATVAVTWGIDRVCESLTGKDLSEFISDGILDSLEKGCEQLSKAGKKVKDTLGNVVSSAGKAITGWWQKVFG